AVPITPAGPPTGSTLMTVGKHTGKSFQQIYQKYRAYCDWALSCEAPSGAVAQLVEYTKTRRATEVVVAAAAPADDSSTDGSSPPRNKRCVRKWNARWADMGG